MGLFLALSGIINKGESDIVDVLGNYVDACGGSFEPKQGTTNDRDILVLAQQEDHVSVLYPGDFCNWDDASRYISEYLDATVLSFHIHDGDLWMYCLFNNGNELHGFNPVPDYWGELDDGERQNWGGDPNELASLLPGVAAESIANYLRPWDDDVLTGSLDHRAYPDDEFAIGDCWQMTDFMKRLGLVYPVGDDGSITGRTFRFRTRRVYYREGAA